jgi:hypothetical protein
VSFTRRQLLALIAASPVLVVDSPSVFYMQYGPNDLELKALEIFKRPPKFANMRITHTLFNPTAAEVAAWEAEARRIYRLDDKWEPLEPT